jgi:hypothetical protein
MGLCNKLYVGVNAEPRQTKQSEQGYALLFSLCHKATIHVGQILLGFKSGKKLFPTHEILDAANKQVNQYVR